MNEINEVLKNIEIINNRLQQNNDRTEELIEKVKKLNERRKK